MRSPRILVSILFLCSLGLVAFAAERRAARIARIAAEAEEAEAEAEALAAAEAAEAEVVEPPAPAWEDHLIRRGETLSEILADRGLDASALRALALPHTDLNRLRAGEILSFYVDPAEPTPTELRYALDDSRTLHLKKEGAGWSASLEVITYDLREGTREFEVRSSLWQAALDAGLRPADIAALARVFQYDIDFNTEVRSGDRARIVVEEQWKDGALVRLGAPAAVRFTNAGKDWLAFRFVRDDGAVGYFDATGAARRKAVLRSPLELLRVTSGFNPKRFHPILKKARPHMGVDFGAPTGTPVHAVGDALVESAGRSGGHGNHVKLQHNGPYESSYSHLSRIAVKRGQKVKQGQIIGYVGSTGLSTGPHLHYQLWVKGQIVNPMTITLPNEEQLNGGELTRFQAERDRALARLDAPEPTDPVADATAGD